jgi:hypothetical protein
MNGQFSVPTCYSCNASSMEHRCFSHVPGTKTFKRNGWYCGSCGTGPQDLAQAPQTAAENSAADDPQAN